MSSMSINVSDIEMTAAHALLQLRCDPAPAQLHVAGASTVVVNCLPAVPTPMNIPSAGNSYAYTAHSQAQAKPRRDTRDLYNGVVCLSIPSPLNGKHTYEQGTQTDAEDPSLIAKLYATIDHLRNQLRTRQYNAHKNRKSRNISSCSCNTTTTASTSTDASNDERKPKAKKRKLNEMLTTKGKDMVPIGEGKALVPAKVLRQINWSSHTDATRKLLTAVFTRGVLATHSLTGKSSPAFPDKPAKRRLNPELVDDIVQMVVERVKVPASVVRTSITTKCADESKRVRSLAQNTKKQKSRKTNKENFPPSPYDSYSDYTDESD